MIRADTLWELVEERAAATPDGPMVVDDAGRRISFGAYRDGAERAAAGLQDQLGIEPGTVVSWQLPNRIETFVLVAALARLGAVQNPIAPLFREREVGFITGQLGADLLLVPSVWRDFDHGAMARSIAAGQPGLRVEVLDGDLPDGDPADLPPRPEAPPTPGGPGAVRWVLYTSGTTSDPKGARHTDGGFIHVAEHMARRMHMGESDRNAVVFPFAHIGGILYVFMDLMVGSASILLERFGPDAVETLSREDVTIAGAGLPFFQQYLRSQRAADRPIFPHVKAFVGGGSTRPPELHAELIEAFGVGLLAGYGLTEAGSFTMSDLDDPDDVRSTTEGRPYPRSEIRIMAPDGTVLAAREEGEVCLRGPQLMVGYVDPALDTAFDADRFFHTGDLGWLDPEGYLHISGRLKDVVIRNGENISAREVEDLVYLHPGVDEVAVVGVPDPQTGERCCAVVTPAAGVAGAGAGGLDLAGLRTFLTDKGLALYKVPEQLEVVDELPKNVGNKVLKAELRERFAAQPFSRAPGR